MPTPLREGPELSGTEDAGILEDGGVPDESCVPEDSATEEERVELEAD